MSSYIEQIRRMREAREKDESPLAAALNQVVGVRAWVNEVGDAKKNREMGDVLFTFDEGDDSVLGPFSVESQVSRKHIKFSYSTDKVGKYKGDYVYLACLERDHDQLEDVQVPMIHVVLKREELEEVLVHKPKGVYLHEKDGREFYTIYPTALAACKSAVFADSLPSVIADLIESVVNPNFKPQ